jgi:hypothetical protein
MNALEKEKLIVSWISFHKTEKGSDVYERNLWAIEKLNDLAEEDPGLCLEIVLLILDRDKDSKLVGSLAAGPVEDLLVFHGHEFIRKIEELAKKMQCSVIYWAAFGKTKCLMISGNECRLLQV